jgi:hypothetical protein
MPDLMVATPFFRLKIKKKNFKIKTQRLSTVVVNQESVAERTHGGFGTLLRTKILAKIVLRRRLLSININTSCYAYHCVPLQIPMRNREYIGYETLRKIVLSCP